MKFKTIAEAFNFYRTKTVAEIETRAAEIKNEIATNSAADVEALNIEAEGLKQAKENAVEKRNDGAKLDPITGAKFGGNPAENGADVFATAEYRNAFFKTLKGETLNGAELVAWNKAQTEKRADAYATTSNAAAVIPTQTLNEIVKKARTMGGIMSVCRGFNIPANLSVPVATPSSAASWHTEGAKVDSEKPDVANVAFAAYEIMKVFSISAAVKRMSVDAFESYLIDELANCVVACLANGVVNGTGTDQGKGILTGVTWTKNTNYVEVAKASSVTYADVVKAIALLKRGYARNAKFAMNNATLYGTFYGMLDSDGRPIFTPDVQNDKVGKILGFEVVVDDYMPADTVLFGNFDYMGYNMPEGIAVEASTQSSFKYGLIDYRAMAIADCKPIVEEAFVKIGKATA